MHLSNSNSNISLYINISDVLCVPQIVGDAVGWGFVVRGSKPCHIQAVDPGGPAAAAGMKVSYMYMHMQCESQGFSVHLWDKRMKQRKRGRCHHLKYK